MLISYDIYCLYPVVAKSCDFLQECRYVKFLKSSRTRHKIGTGKLYRISHSCVELSNAIGIGEGHTRLLSFDGLKIKTSC